MAGHLMVLSRVACVLSGVLLVLAWPAIAENATTNVAADPLRPPDAFINPQAGATLSPGSSRLASVKIPRPRGRPSAVIDGRVVRLGEMVGESRLIRINEQQVVLEGPNGDKETLTMTPDVAKQPVVVKSLRQRKKETL